MKTNLTLSKKLSKYSTLALAFAGVAEADGQIVYNDVSPDVTVTNSTYNLDLNGDGTTDFIISQTTSTSSKAVYLKPQNNNECRGFLNTSSGWVYPFALNAGDPIGPSQTDFRNNAGQTLNINSCTYSNSQWCGGKVDKYLGLKFKIGTDVHYGWVRLDLPANASSVTIKDYAYNTTANQALNSGQMTLSTKEVVFEDFNYYVDRENTINFTSSKDIQSIRIHNVMGQLVHEEEGRNIKKVSLANAHPGIYMVSVSLDGLKKNFKIRLK